MFKTRHGRIVSRGLFRFFPRIPRGRLTVRTLTFVSQPETSGHHWSEIELYLLGYTAFHVTLQMAVAEINEASVTVASYADILWARHAIFLPLVGRLLSPPTSLILELQNIHSTVPLNYGSRCGSFTRKLENSEHLPYSKCNKQFRLYLSKGNEKQTYFYFQRPSAKTSKLVSSMTSSVSALTGWNVTRVFKIL